MGFDYADFTMSISKCLPTSKAWKEMLSPVLRSLISSAMEPAHKVWRSKLNALAWQINKAIDNGNYELDIDEVRRAASEGRIVDFMKEQIPNYPLLDFSLWTDEDCLEVNDWFVSSNGNYDAFVENKGLCLLMAWTLNMLQEARHQEDL